MVVPFVYTEEEYKKLEKERDNCLKEVKLCYNDIHSLEGQISDLEEENRNLKSDLDKFRDSFKKYRDYEKEELAESCYDLARENKKLKEKLDVLGKAKFEIMAYIDMCHPTTYLKAEELQKRKELFERTYNEKLYFLEKENKNLKSDLAYERTMLDNVKAEYENLQDVIKKLNERIRFLEQCLDNKEKVNISLREENKRLSDFLECES